MVVVLVVVEFLVIIVRTVDVFVTDIVYDMYVCV